MGKVELPVADPMYSTYHFLASAGIAAMQNPTWENWYYNYTVDLRCNRKFLQGYTSPTVGLESAGIWVMTILDKSAVNNRFARYCSLQIIKTMLDEGYYVYFAGIDDYYIKGKSWYQERHFPHGGLISGYDDEEETFTMVAYDSRWLFTTFKTPQSCFVEGLEAMCSQGHFETITAFRANNIVLDLDINMIRKDLKKYLSSNLNQYPMNEPEHVWGIILYDYICLYLDKLMDGSVPYDRKDRRIFRMIWEHKKCMYKRIIAVENECGWDHEISDAYEKVVKLGDKARFIYSKFVLKYSSKNLENIQIILMEMKDLDNAILGKFLKRLEEYIDVE